MKSSPQFAVSGAGSDEVSSTALLEQAGFSVRVCEQAPPGNVAYDVSFVVPVRKA